MSRKHILLITIVTLISVASLVFLNFRKSSQVDNVEQNEVTLSKPQNEPPAVGDIQKNIADMVKKENK